MNVLITGGAGYIGSHCNFLLNKKGVQTIVLDDLSSGHREAVKQGIFIKGDFSDENVLKSIFNTAKIDAVIHLAAFADVPDSVQNPDKYYKNNVSKLITLLEVMAEYSVRHIIFSSSAAIFGEPDYIPIDELHKELPINPYGETKLIGEKLLRDYGKAYGIKYAALRYFNAAGAANDCELGESHSPEHHLIPLILQSVLKKREMLVYGGDYATPDGTCIRDFIHVADLAQAHYSALNYILGNDVSESFNLGSNTGFSVLEIIKIFERISKRKVNFTITERRPGDPARLIASKGKAKQLLKWEPQLGVEQILLSAWKWEEDRKY
ncbi:MAG: UDP-glucose 4-epimerase GalE [Veillonellales bacterium]